MSNVPQQRAVEGGTTLRVRLLLGLGLALALPFLLFAWIGDKELRRSTKRNLGRYLLASESRGTSRRIGDWLAQTRVAAETIVATAEMRSVFRDRSARSAAFRSFHPRVSELFGDIVLVSADYSVLFESKRGSPTVIPSGRKLTDEPLRTWMDAVNDGQLRFFAPVADPRAESAMLSSTRDPEQYVLPLVIPILDDTQVGLGACFFLLPFSHIQDEIEHTRQYLVDEADIQSAEVYLVDRASGRFLLHTDRSRIGQRAELRNVEGFTEESDGSVRAANEVESQGSLAWSSGVRADGAELFRSVDTLSRFFLGLVVIVIGATLGIATLISVAATRSLGKLERVTEALGTGDLGARAAVAGPREARKLAVALNTMAAQLERERERLKVAERDRAWTAMARQVAHEIKNPLQPVKLHAELIQRMLGEGGPSNSERAAASAGVILRQVSALQRIVADFSEYAHAALPLTERHRFKASDVMDELVQLYAAGGAVVRFVDESGDAELFGSRLRLQQVLVNLIKNAIEASAEAGAIEIEVTARVAGGKWVAEVRDRGCGLPEGGSRQAFEPSYSTKPGGTGLGLAICQRNVDAMGGTISLLPREGGGCTARIELELGPGPGRS